MADTTYFAVGASMKSKQDVTARLGDALSNLYLASTTLRYFESNGSKKEEENMMHWACQQCLSDAETAMDELINNYPVKPLRALLRPLVFPLSVIPFVSPKRFNGPSDELTHKAADAIIEPGVARDEIASGIFVPKGKGEHIAEMMEAFNDAVNAAPIEEKISAAVRKRHKKDVPDNEKILSKPLSEKLNEAVEKGIISKEDVALLNKAEESRNSIIRVDDFSNDLSEVRGSRLNKTPAAPANSNEASSQKQVPKANQGGMKP
jgi:hypothetical protein